MAGAIHFANQSTEFNLVVDRTNFRSYGTGDDPDDGTRVTVGLRHNLGFMTLYAGGQYFKDSRKFVQEAGQFYTGIGQHSDPHGTRVTPFLSADNAKDGFGLNLGIDYPALGGTWKAQVGYMNAEFSEDSSKEMSRWFVSAGYWYDFSKRTTLYSGIGFMQDQLEGGEYDQFDDANVITASLGIVHNF